MPAVRMRRIGGRSITTLLTTTRELLMDAVRYNERPDGKAQLELEIEGAVDQRHLEELLAQITRQCR